METFTGKAAASERAPTLTAGKNIKAVRMVLVMVSKRVDTGSGWGLNKAWLQKGKYVRDTGVGTDEKELNREGMATDNKQECSPNPGPRTGAGPWINRHRAARGTSNHFTVAGGRGAEHCALPSGLRKNYQTFTGPRR
ncbi:hypothetical protein NDU88_001146 [Pleurodeles waltl]|uniref:Uncharacterized protein n=1 Tax=Pleurodeles waltl TaxID=8319 RepID=A0AAV7NDE7_PLEWA|nr:hypothetical protein NDU88_001146 [Pleurodeles waltl]